MHHPLGCHLIGNRYYFTVYAPSARRVRLAFFKSCDTDIPQKTVPMRSVGNGRWEFSDVQSMEGMYYAFLINRDKTPVCDPYARFVSTFQDFRQSAKALVYHDEFSWEGDTPQAPKDPRDLTVYECHIGDYTADLGDTAFSYLGMIERIPYLKDLGINAIELLPIQKFAIDEPPYNEEIGHLFNNWNPYAENYWGYMTSYFFAPENRYASGTVRKKASWADTRGREGHELKTMIKAFHQAGISVIMDVVYNHLSHYDDNPLRRLAPEDYLQNSNDSGCGNDMNTSHPAARKLIIDSLLHWMKEYHIDGFRFDLTGILDDDTLTEAKEACRAVNSNVILYGEPWGRRYFPARMSELGYGSWNDRFRNGIKGENPFDRKGYIFGNWDHGVTPEQIIGLMTGTLRQKGGLFLNSAHSVNYLSSHDGYTFGDFIRLACGRVTANQTVNRNEILVLDRREERIYRLGMFALCFSQGMIMLHGGQEFARTKVIAKRKEAGELAGTLDHNSYNKDDETNYIFNEDLETNPQLREYVKGLLAIRCKIPELRAADPATLLSFFSRDNEFGLGYGVESSRLRLAVLMNTSEDKSAHFELKSGGWVVLASEERSDLHESLAKGAESVELPPQSCRLLVMEK